MKKLTAYLIAAVVGLLIIVGVSAVSQGQRRQTIKPECPDCHPCETARGHELGLPYNVNCQTESNDVLAKKTAQRKPVDEDALLAQRFEPWYAQVLRLAPRYGYHIKASDESWREYFWLHHFLQDASPRKALIDSRKGHSHAN